MVELRAQSTAGQVGEQMPQQPTVELLKLALTRQVSALSKTVALLTPWIQARIARHFLRSRSVPPAMLRREVQHRTEEMLLSLFADDARLLRRFDPRTDGSLETFVGQQTELWLRADPCSAHPGQRSG